MLDPRFKSLHLVSSFIDCEQGVVIVEEYDIDFVFYAFRILSSFATLLELKINLLTKKWMVEYFWNSSKDRWTNKKKLVKKNLFECFQMDIKGIKCLLQWWWEKHKAIFLTIAFLAFEILDIIDSQIETKRIFSLVNILTNLRRQKI